MAKAETDYAKHYKNLFNKNVLPVLKDEIKAVELAKEKQQSLTNRFEQNENDLVSLNNDLTALRSESVEHVMSDGKGDEYIQKMSKIKGRISLLQDAQDEIKKYLLPGIKEQLDKAYKDLVAATNQSTAVLANRVRDEIFNTVQEQVDKMEGYEAALFSLGLETLALPRNADRSHRIDFDDIPYFPELVGFLQGGKWWTKE